MIRKKETHLCVHFNVKYGNCEAGPRPGSHIKSSFMGEG